MSITAYKVEAVGHDRTGEDYGYVNIMYRYGNKKFCPPAGSVRENGGHVGGRERLWAACSWQQGGRLYTDMADGLLGLRSIYPPGDRPAAHGYLHRSEDQGTGVV